MVYYFSSAYGHLLFYYYIFRGSAAVAQFAVNELVAGSNPAPGATRNTDNICQCFYIIGENLRF